MGVRHWRNKSKRILTLRCRPFYPVRLLNYNINYLNVYWYWHISRYLLSFCYLCMECECRHVIGTFWPVRNLSWILSRIISTCLSKSCPALCHDEENLVNECTQFFIEFAIRSLLSFLMEMTCHIVWIMTIVSFLMVSLPLCFISLSWNINKPRLNQLVYFKYASIISFSITIE